MALSFDYRASESWPDLPRLRSALERLVTTWSPRLPHVLDDLVMSDEPTAVMAAVEDLLLTQLRSDDAIVIYVGGHGARLGADHFVAGPAAAPGYLTSRNGLAASDLAQVIGQGRPSQVALLIDTCYSGAAGARAAASVDDIISRVAKDGFSMFVMSSAHAEELAWDGVFVEGLLDALTDPDPLLWSNAERFVAPSQVARALRARLGTAIESREYNYVEPLLPNLAFRESSAGVRDAATLAREHFLRAASGQGGDDTRWHFAGRRPVFARISAWLRESPQGMFVLTGPPGAGKSAVLGLIALLSDETGRRAVTERAEGLFGDDHDDPSGWVPMVDAAVYARDKALADIVAELAQTLGYEPPRGPDDLLARLAAIHESITVLVDALDEASSEELPRITSFLRDLADLPRVRVLVGTRPDRARAEYGPRFGPLLRGLEPVTMLDLAEDEGQSRSDVADYVRQRLRAGGGDGASYEEELLDEVGDEIAYRTRGVFLYARLMTEILLRGAHLDAAGDWRGALPGPDGGDLLATVVGQDLGRIPTRRREIVRRMLMALSFAEGEGLPRYRIWATVATALTGTEHGDEDAATTLTTVPWYLAESREAGEQVYRLNHEELIKYFRATAIHEF